MKVIFYSGDSLISRLIKWRTRSQYSHVAIETDGHVYESSVWLGVTKTKHGNSQYEYMEHFDIHLTPDQKTILIAFLEAQLWKGYDYTLIWAIALNKIGNRRWKWICSELVQKALEKIGFLKACKIMTPWDLFFILYQLNNHKKSL